MAHQPERGRAVVLQLTSTLRFVTFALMLILSSVKLSRMVNGTVGSWDANKTAAAVSIGTRREMQLIFMLTRRNRYRVNSHSRNPLYSVNRLLQEIEAAVKPPGVFSVEC
jgi:hypothetical protein